MKYYFDAFKNYADIKGTLGRKGYWMFMLINVIVFLILQIVGTAFGFSALGYLYMIVSVIPLASATARRLTDAGKSRFWIFAALIFPIGTLFVIYFLCKKTKNN